MRKIVLYIAMSIDGYIAAEDGGVGWLEGDDSEPENLGSYPSFIKTIDTVILGWKTYQQIVTKLSPQKWIYSGKTSYVLTHRNLSSSEEIIFTDQSLDELLKTLKSSSGANIWICGGAEIVNQMMEYDLIDQYCISVIPTILGGGISLFGQREHEMKLRLVSVCRYNGIVDLFYERREYMQK